MAEVIQFKGGRLVWHGKTVSAWVERVMERRLDVVAERVKTQVQKNISVSTRAHGPSRPGEFPHADTGRLRNTIFWVRTAKFTRIVGTPLKYGLWLEKGTGRLLARPYLRRTVMNMRPMIVRTLTMPIAGMSRKP